MNRSGNVDQESVSKFDVSQSWQAGVWTTDDYDFKQLLAELTVQVNLPQPTALNDVEHYEWPGDYIESCAPNVTTGIMTMAADLLTGQKLGWSVLGGMISGLTVKDGEFNKYLGGLISNAFGTNIANMMTDIAGAAATGATTAVATGASITTTVAASVSTNG